jgi:hypothetical protein
MIADGDLTDEETVATDEVRVLADGETRVIHEACDPAVWQKFLVNEENVFMNEVRDFIV